MRYLFEDYAFDTDRRELHRGADLVSVTPQVFDLLDYLIRNREHVVSRDELISVIWNGRSVSEAALATRLNAARTAIGDTGEQQRLIKTLPRKGFRFVGLVREAQVPAGVADNQVEAPKPALALPDKPSIAILPFTNLSSDPEQDYFADGIVEDITTALSRFKSLFVIARNSSFTYKGKAVDVKQIGRELGVRYVLEGSVRRSGGRVRITGQLIEVATGAHLWADKTDGTLEGVFELQDEVTTRVVGAIQPSITQAEINRAQAKPTSNLDAYDLYLKALSVHYSQTRTDVEGALRLLEQAIALDPSFSCAKAFAAHIHVLRLIQGWVARADLEIAQTLAREALFSGRDDPNTLGYAAHALAFLAREYEVPIACMDRALQLNPNSAYILMLSGHLRGWVADADRAIDHILRSMRLSPVDPQLGYHYQGLSVAHVIKGEYEKALEYARRAAQEMPRYVIAWAVTAIAAAYGGHQEEANAAVKQILALSPTFTIALRSSNSAYRDKWVVERMAQGLRLAGLPEG